MNACTLVFCWPGLTTAQVYDNDDDNNDDDDDDDDVDDDDDDDDGNDDDICRNNCCHFNITVYGNHKPVVGPVTRKGQTLTLKTTLSANFTR